MMTHIKLQTRLATIYRHAPTLRLALPLLSARVPAGFPALAEDYIEGRIDLNRALVKHPLATFYLRVIGDSMEPIFGAGALLVVDRMAETKDDDIVVARVGGDLCVKRLRIETDGRILLLSKNKTYPPIVISEEMDFEVCGRVMHSIQTH